MFELYSCNKTIECCAGCVFTKGGWYHSDNYVIVGNVMNKNYVTFSFSFPTVSEINRTASCTRAGECTVQSIQYALLPLLMYLMYM